MSEAARADDEVLWQVEAGIATITLNAPHRMNTISGPMLKRLTEFLVRAGEAKDVRVVILTGTGRAFCAGLNLEAQAKGTDTSPSAPALRQPISTCATRRRPCCTRSTSRWSARSTARRQATASTSRSAPISA
jgi:enoyl-CoA hydratase/carnithine racemase